MTASIPRPLSVAHHGPQPMIRAEGIIRGRFTSHGQATEIARLYESGGYRLKFPKSEVCEAVIVNTGGGMAGGDRFTLDLDMTEMADVTVTTQSAEKLYRADGETSRIDMSLRIGPRACVTWVPQEMIMFSGAHLSRSVAIEMAEDASVLFFESIVFGRLARGERVTDGLLRDRWRIKRNNKLIFAEDTRVDQPIADRLDHRAIGAGARAVATCFYAAPDAEGRLDDVRQCLGSLPCECAASAWNGMMVIRFLAEDPQLLRRSVTDFLVRFRNTALPRVWQC